MRYATFLFLGMLSAAACSDSAASLHRAAYEGDLPAVTRLIESGAEVNAKDELGSTPLHYAVWGNDPEITRTLLERGADPNIRALNGQTALDVAVQANRGEIIRLLSRYDAELGSRGSRSRR